MAVSQNVIVLLRLKLSSAEAMENVVWFSLGVNIWLAISGNIPANALLLVIVPSSSPALTISDNTLKPFTPISRSRMNG
jgi:hypothetical protein